MSYEVEYIICLIGLRTISLDVLLLEKKITSKINANNGRFNLDTIRIN